MANSHIEDEEKIGSDEEIASIEQEDKPKKPTNSELVKTLVENKQDKTKEEEKKMKEDEDKVIIETQKPKNH